MVKLMRLSQGPSREEFFDCLRLGSADKQRSNVEFWTEQNLGSTKSGSRLLVDIEGIHRATDDDNGREWFFWGRRAIVTPADTLTWRSSQKFIFGRWNTYSRRGQIVISDDSIFRNELTPFALFLANDLGVWDTFDYGTEQSVFAVCQSHWDSLLAHSVCLRDQIPYQTERRKEHADNDFNMFVASLPTDAHRNQFIVKYLEALKANVVGKANCGCVYHAEQGVACPHDLALLVRSPASKR